MYSSTIGPYTNPINVIYKNKNRLSVEMFDTFAELLAKTEIHPYIIELNMVDRGMTSIPDEIDRFTELERFNCSNNYLTMLPMTITKLTKLKDLFAIDNHIVILPPEIGNLVALTRIDVQENRIDSLPPSFEDLKNLTFVNFCGNKFRHFPDVLCKIGSLTSLYFNFNYIKKIPDAIRGLKQIDTISLCGNRICTVSPAIGNLRTLKKLDLQDNCIAELPESIGNLVELEELRISNNVHLAEIPNTIGDCRALTRIEMCENQIRRLPIEITQCTNLRSILTANNPIEISPIVQRFINRNRNVLNHANLYRDGQNVHTSSIQESIKKSLISLFNDTYNVNKDTVIDHVVADRSINAKNKQLLIGYINDEKESHSTLYCTFFDAFMKVYGRIIGCVDTGRRTELYKRLNEELDDGECKCFTGRLSRMVNVLDGFFDDIRIGISENEQISNVILVLRHKNGINLDDDMNETIKERIRAELKERGYEDDIIDVWLNV